MGEATAEEGGTSTGGIESEEGEGEGQLMSSDEEEVEKQEQFERQYNFRFEEPGGTDVSEQGTPATHSHPRLLETHLKLEREQAGVPAFRWVKGICALSAQLSSWLARVGDTLVT